LLRAPTAGILPLLVPGRSTNLPHRAFTLVEVLVVVAIVSIVTGILLPTLAAAREGAWAAQSMSTQRTLAQGLLRYAGSNDEWLPGLNTSGLNLWPIHNVNQKTWDRLSRDPHAPVQNVDWITPSIAGDLDLPADREARFIAILQHFADPAMRLTVPALVDGKPGGEEMAEHLLARGEGAPGVSFLMSMNFQATGALTHYDPVDKRYTRIGQQNYAAGELKRQHIAAKTYTPRTTRVGPGARKIAFADGFRYIDSPSEAIDFDAAYSPFEWGSFAERTPVEQTSRAWGRLGAGGSGANLPLAYRHGGQMDAAFFDGHVEMLTPRESRDPALWAPSGSTFTGLRDTDPDSLGFGHTPSREQNAAKPVPPASVLP